MRDAIRWRSVLAVALFWAVIPVAESAQEEAPAPGKPAGGTEATPKPGSTPPAGEEPPPTSPADGLAVEAIPGLIGEFPGFDLKDLPPDQREKLIKKANKVYCTCGCRGDTVARCVVIDPSCRTARKMLQAMLDALDGSEATPEAKPAAPSGTPEKPR